GSEGAATNHDDVEGSGVVLRAAVAPLCCRVAAPHRLVEAVAIKAAQNIERKTRTLGIRRAWHVRPLVRLPYRQAYHKPQLLVMQSYVRDQQHMRRRGLAAREGEILAACSSAKDTVGYRLSLRSLKTAFGLIRRWVAHMPAARPRRTRCRPHQKSLLDVC